MDLKLEGQYKKFKPVCHKYHQSRSKDSKSRISKQGLVGIQITRYSSQVFTTEEIKAPEEKGYKTSRLPPGTSSVPKSLLPLGHIGCPFYNISYSPIPLIFYLISPFLP